MLFANCSPRVCSFARHDESGRQRERACEGQHQIHRRLMPEQTSNLASAALGRGGTSLGRHSEAKRRPDRARSNRIFRRSLSRSLSRFAPSLLWQTQRTLPPVDGAPPICASASLGWERAHGRAQQWAVFVCAERAYGNQFWATTSSESNGWGREITLAARVSRAALYLRRVFLLALVPYSSQLLAPFALLLDLQAANIVILRWRRRRRRLTFANNSAQVQSVLISLNRRGPSASSLPLLCSTTKDALGWTFSKSGAAAQFMFNFCHHPRGPRGQAEPARPRLLSGRCPTTVSFVRSLVRSLDRCLRPRHAMRPASNLPNQRA